ncbi:hypothetical protein P9265_15200 [Schinkia azotoformans]|uniref:hypothetical protein n=1 Tax=Schinkia azotoformans TaxID=1454 RepID=UPI002E24EA52|nr:hypothetical protein [Schinkia azotoformans]
MINIEKVIENDVLTLASKDDYEFDEYKKHIVNKHGEIQIDREIHILEREGFVFFYKNKMTLTKLGEGRLSHLQILLNRWHVAHSDDTVQ